MFNEKDSELINKGKKCWSEGTLADSLQQLPEIQQNFETLSGIPVQRVYTPLDIAHMDYMSDLGFPGEYPYTRGSYPTMYRSKPWSIRQITGCHGAEEANLRYKWLLSQGITTLSVANDYKIFDAFADPDEPEYKAIYGDELGRTGWASVTLKDWEIAFDGIPLDKISVSLNYHHFATRQLAMYIALAKMQGVPLDKLEGTSQSDILQDFSGNYYPDFPPESELKIVMDLFKFCCDYIPKWNVISMGGYNRQEAGATSVQELAFTLADAVTFVRTAIAAGLDVDRFAPRFTFMFAANNDFFETIAKLRAARRMWAKIMRNHFGAKDPSSWRMRIHVQTSGYTLTRQQPLNNIVRAAIQGLAAVLGGVNSLHIDSYDEALATPTEASARLSVRTAQIIWHETQVCNTVDPLCGSYFLEVLTNQMEQEAEKLIQEIENMGGSLAAIRNGYYAEKLKQSVITHQTEMDKKERIIVGVNEYIADEQLPIEIQKPSPEATQRTLARLQQVKATRDNRKVKEALEKLKRAASGEGNIMAATVEAAEAFCTFAEMNRALREVYGVYKHPTYII